LSESFALILVTQSKIKKSFRETIALVKKNNYSKNNSKEEQLQQKQQ